MPRLIDPRAAFERLFGARDAEGRLLPQPARADDSSLLDAALEDANDLRRRLGKGDQQKLDEYLESVHSVESRIRFTRKDTDGWRPPTKPEKLTPPPSMARAAMLFKSSNNDPDAADSQRIDHRELVRLMLDLMVLAFWTDTTRNLTFMFANDVSSRSFSFLDGVTENHHNSSHHQSKPEKIESYKIITRWHVEQFVYLLQRLQGIAEGERSLLDNAMILCGSSLSDGNEHSPNNLPILLGGKGGGRLHTGQHLAFERDTPLCNLYVSMLECQGIQVPRFGDSTEPLKGVLA
jgi:hypothetical protein